MDPVTPTDLNGWIEATGLPAGVRGGTATRRFAGVSAPPYGRANYGGHCGDDAVAVARNRVLLRESLGLQREPVWLRQVHGTAVVVVSGESSGASLVLQEQAPTADACVVRGHALAAVIQTADCLPILLAAAGSDEVAAIHAGWRGLAAGVIEATLAAMHAARGSLQAWLGPAIGQRAFEVGPEVRAAFVDADPGAAACFERGRDDRWHADLAELARRRLAAVGVSRIGGGGWCTVESPAEFHSYRRDGDRSGRMATLIWRA